MSAPITVHLVCNSHLDPIWLWSYRDGLDEVLNTAYALCDLLDRRPEVIYTRGEAWVYEQIHRIDPKLFERVRGHVAAGRWSLVGGWYIQPDCNLPSGFAMERQIALGQAFFREHFGQVPGVAYNVDSFGHAATLPGLMHAAGQSAYVMMRPQEAELTLPARLFRWRGYADGPEVAVFRIAAAYNTSAGVTAEHVLASVADLPPGVAHTMCFVGIGDHGGGPTEEIIEWCQAHRDAFPGVRLTFSSPQKFFAAVAGQIAGLPLVTGELQQHAIGCYTVQRRVKVAVRQTEHRLVQAAHASDQPASEETARALTAAWKRVCFHHFHDTLGGTCLPSAYQDVDAQLGQAFAAAEETATLALRREMVRLPHDPAQRLLFRNASDLPFSDHIEIEPWLEGAQWQASWALQDETGRVVPCQRIDSESRAEADQVRLTFHLQVPPDTLRILRIVELPAAPPLPPGGVRLAGEEAALQATDAGTGFELGSVRRMTLSGTSFALPELFTYADGSDTWGHGVARYPRTEPHAARWQATQKLVAGPLLASFVQAGSVGASELQAEWRVYRDTPWVECLLRVVWVEKRRVLKLEWNLPGPIREREDGILGGSLIRPTDGRELPLRDWTRVRIDSGGAATEAAVVAPDVFGLEVEPRRIGLTLLRSCTLARHDPNPGTHPRSVFSDRGEHLFRFRFLAAPELTSTFLDQTAVGWQRPLLSADCTRGMAKRFLRAAYRPVAESS